MYFILRPIIIIVILFVVELLEYYSIWVYLVMLDVIDLGPDVVPGLSRALCFILLGAAIAYALLAGNLFSSLW